MTIVADSATQTPPTDPRKPSATMTLNGHTYESRELCTTNPYSRTNRWVVTVARDGQRIASYTVISTSTRQGYRLNCPNPKRSFTSWADCHAALIVHAAQQGVLLLSNPVTGTALVPYLAGSQTWAGATA